MTTDGRIGPQTLSAIRTNDTAGLIRALCAARTRFLQQLPTFAVFGRGWTRARDGHRAREPAPCGSSFQPLRTGGANRGEHHVRYQDSSSEPHRLGECRGFAALGLSLMGFQTTGLDVGLVTDRLLDLVAAGSFVASTFFRVVATKRLI